MYYVEVVKFNGDEVVKTLLYTSETQAVKSLEAVYFEIDTDNYYARIRAKAEE